MSTLEIRIGLVGCGGVVRQYRKVYRGLPWVRVVTAIDVNLEEAEAAAEELGASRASTRFEEALEPDIDAVVISTPNHLHVEQAPAAFEAGKHVLLQKPMARTIEECDRILEAQRRSGKVLGIYMNLLDHSLFRDLKRMAQSGYLGAIGLVSARLAHRGGLSWGGADVNWRASREDLRAPGSQRIHLACYAVRSDSQPIPS
jgi:predicted dehydrogenase